MWDRFNVEMLPGEECIIEAKPVRSIYARKGWAMSLLGVPLLIAASLLEYLASTVPLPFGVPGTLRLLILLCGVPFVLLGLFFSVGHYILYYLEGKSVRYMVTNRRIIIRRGRVLHKHFEIFLDRIAGIDVVEYGGPQRAGTIHFLASRIASVPFYMRKFPTEKFRGEVKYAIEAVPRVEEVRHKIENAMGALSKG